MCITLTLAVRVVLLGSHSKEEAALLGGDIKIMWDEESLHGNFSYDESGADISTDIGLETAVIVSLFTDRRAEGEELPQGERMRRGWWGDSVAAIRNDRIGSRLWLLFREKSLTSVALRAKEYAEEALQWLVRDKIATAVNVTAEIQGGDRLCLGINIIRPDGKSTLHRYNLNWHAQEEMHDAV